MSAGAPKNVARFLKWDTQFFGMRIASVEAEGMSAEQWQAALAFCREERVRCLYVLAEVDGPWGSYPKGLDVRLTLRREAAPLPPITSAGTLRLAREDDIPVLRALAMVAHDGTRFWQDEHFARERCAELYATWIERSVRGWADAVFVAEAVSAPVGYVTCHARAEEVEIGLIAVAESWQGQGIGKALVHQALAWGSERGLARARVVTGAANMGAIGLYARCGFQRARLQSWFHLWFP